MNKIEEICKKHGNTDDVIEAVREAVAYKESEFREYHRPIYDVEDYKNYKRHLIQLRPDVAILLHIFTMDSDQFETIWLDDNEKYHEADMECIKDSAHQLLMQLEGHWCDAFIKALRDECNEILKRQ